jgi:hypothetical protein
MSQQINPVAVRDTVLDLDDKINFAVKRSGQNITIQKYPANSATATQHVYSVQVPSTSTIVSRNLTWGCDVTFAIAGTPGAGEFLVNLSQVNAGTPGGTANWFGADGLAPFPISQMCTNMSCQINNTTVSVPLQRILDPLLRAVDKKYFERWNSTTPTQLDKYGSYSQAILQRINTAGGTFVPAAPPGLNTINLQSSRQPAFNSPFNTFQDSNCNNNEVPRNSFKIKAIYSIAAGVRVAPVAGDGATGQIVYVNVELREPLFLSPFLFGEDVDQPGLSGLTQLNFTMQMDPNAVRAWRWYNDPNTFNKTITVSYDQAACYIEALYYTPKPSDMIPATIVTPLATYTQYQLPATAVLQTGIAGVQTSNSIMLNSYPDKVFIYVDDAQKYVVPAGTGILLNANGNGIPDHYATITGIDITLNNQSGIMSTFSLEQLYKASVKSGSQQTFAEFSGLQQQWLTANVNLGGVAQYTPTCGSVLMLNFGDIISIAQDYYAPGSLATAQFQVRVNYVNNQNQPITPQLNLIMMYSGILSTSNGASSAYTSGVLTKENVLNAAAVPRPMNDAQLHRYVGSGLLSDLKSIATSALPMLKSQVLAPAVQQLGSMALDRISRKLKA